VLTAVAGVLAVVVIGLAGYWGAHGVNVLWSSRGDGDLSDARAAAVAAARQEALNLIAVDGTNTDAKIKDVLDGATGTFKADFTSRSADLKRVIAGAKVVSSDLKVVESAVVRFDEESATVIVAADSIVKNSAKPAGSPRTYRMLLELELHGDRWLTASLEVVG
jgi:Mce-associated membrane protein